MTWLLFPFICKSTHSFNRIFVFVTSCFRLINYRHQHSPAGDVHHSLPISPVSFILSWWQVLKGNWKTMAKKHFLYQLSLKNILNDLNTLSFLGLPDSTRVWYNPYLVEFINQWWIIPVNDHFIPSSVWRMQNIWSLVSQWNQNPYW